MKKKHKKKYTVVDLFSGAGGLELGFIDAGFDVLLSTDFDEYCEKVHQLNSPNIPFINSDIYDLTNKKLRKLIHKEIDVLVGGPPCQGFSTIGARISSNPKIRKRKDPRNSLFQEYIRILKFLKPKFFLMENVVGLLTKDKGAIFKKICDAFTSTGYKFDYIILNAADYGVPQIRNRVFFYGTRTNVNINPPTSTHSSNGKNKWITVGESIGDLANIYCDESINHVPLNHGEKNIARYKLIPEGGRMPEHKLPKELYRKNFGGTFKRLHRNKPALTMVPGHNAFPIHPWLNRSLTVREAARLQSFPDNYIFVGPRQKQCMQVGNAVPPKLSNAWAKRIKKCLEEYEKKQK